MCVYSISGTVVNVVALKAKGRGFKSSNGCSHRAEALDYPQAIWPMDVKNTLTIYHMYIHVCILYTMSTRVYRLLYHEQYIFRGLKAREVYASGI